MSVLLSAFNCGKISEILKLIINDQLCSIRRASRTDFSIGDKSTHSGGHTSLLRGPVSRTRFWCGGGLVLTYGFEQYIGLSTTWPLCDKNLLLITLELDLMVFSLNAVPKKREHLGPCTTISLILIKYLSNHTWRCVFYATNIPTEKVNPYQKFCYKYVILQSCKGMSKAYYLASLKRVSETNYYDVCFVYGDGGRDISFSFIENYCIYGIY